MSLRIKILLSSLIFNLLCVFIYAYLVDFHPQFKGFIHIFAVKSVANGIFCAMWFLHCSLYDEFTIKPKETE